MRDYTTIQAYGQDVVRPASTAVPQRRRAAARRARRGWRADRRGVDCGMPSPLPVAMRTVAIVAALALLAVGGTLGYIAIVALRRSEGVFMPAGYVALACLAAGAYLLRVGLRS